MDWAVSTTMTLDDHVSATFRRMEAGTRSFGDAAEKSFRRASSSSSRFGDIVKGVLAANVIQRGAELIKDGLFGIVQEASKIEDATASFTPLMGSVDKAKELVARLNKEAATTPFQFEGIAGVAKQLLPVMNGSIEDTADTFRMLGDTAGGNIEKLDSITRGYVKALLKGKPDMESMNMIAEAGVPIFTEMAASMGITRNQLFEMSKQGKLTTDHLTGAFKRMTSEGGIFFKGMEISSQTFSGVMSTLRDNIALTAADVGTEMLPTLKDLAQLGISVAKSVSEWVKNNKELIQTKIQSFISVVTEAARILWPIIKTTAIVISELFGWIYALRIPLTIIISAFIAFRAIMMTMGIISTVTTMITTLQGGLILAGGAWKFFNLMVAANPLVFWVSIIALVIGAIAALIIYWDELTAAFKGWFGVADEVGSKMDSMAEKAAKASSAAAVSVPGANIPAMPGGIGAGAGMTMPAIGGEGGGMAMPEIPSQAQITTPTPESQTQKMKLEFYGRIDVFGLPKESKFTRTGGNAPDIDVALLGENK